MKHAISVTLHRDNLVWLKGQAAARTGGNVSEVVNTLIREARTAGRTDPGAIKSVVGTIDLPDDEALAEADAQVRALFDRSLSRPMLVRETPPEKSKRPRRG
jgi:hypothetical protein